MKKINIEEVWKNQPTESATLQDEEINNIRMRKSEGFLERLQSNARLEHYLNISVSIITTAGLLIAQKWVAGLIALVLFSTLILYYYKLYNELWQLRPTADVHEFLQIITTKMKSFIRRYYAGLFIIMPLSMYFGIWLASGGDVNWEEFTSIEGFSVMSTAILLACLLSYFMVELMYGRTYKKLKALLAEMESGEVTY